jgi:hypothetical protein
VKETVMASRQQEMRYSRELDEWAEQSAWQGYEFWSAQLEAEAEMAFLSELEQTMKAAPEGQSDVLPF